jgi:hypothetical protein
MGWSETYLPCIWNGFERNVRWEMLSTYLKALEANGDTIDLECSPFIHKL